MPSSGFLGGNLTPIVEIGIAVAALLLLLARLIVPGPERRKLRAPFVLLLLHMMLVVVLALLPEPTVHDDGGPMPPAQFAHRATQLIAASLILFSMARSFYLCILHGLLARGDRRRSLPGIFRDIIQVGLYAVVALAVLSMAGVEAGSLLTTSALLTAVVGLSLQDTLGNLFAGLAIQAQQPFEVGDWIQFEESEESVGEVLETNWRATRLLTIERIEVTVPNNVLAKAPISNFSRPTRLVRRNATVIAPYEAPPARVHRLMTEAVVEVEGVRRNPPPDIQTIEFNERGVEYRVRYFIEDFHQREIIDSRVRDRLWYALRRAALAIPPPQRRITMIEQNAASAERDYQQRVASVEKALARLPLFKPLSHDLVHELALHTERRLYAPGELIIQQGDYGEELFVIERGNVEVLLDAHDGMQHVATLTPSEFFGEMSLMTGESRRATVRAEAEVALLVVSKEALAPILEGAPGLASDISDILAARDAQLHEAEYNEAEEEEHTERSGELLTRIRQFFSL